MLSANLQRLVVFLLGLVGGVTIVAVATFAFLALFNEPPKPAVAEIPVNQETQVDKETKKLSDETSAQDTEIVELDLQQLPKQSYFERARVFHSYLRGRGVDFVVDFLEETATIDSSSFRQEAQEAGIRRLAQLDPIRALSSVQEFSETARSSLTTVVFDEWSADDLDTAIEHAHGLRQDDQRSAVKGILSSASELSDTDRVELARQLGYEEMVVDELTLRIAGEPIEDPLAAWSGFVEDNGGDVANLSHAQLVLLKHILDSCVESADSTTVASAVKSALVAGVGNQSAVQLLLESSATVDPSVALHAASSVEDVAIRSKLVEAVVLVWIEMDPLVVLNDMELIPDEFHDWSKQIALIALSATLPSEAARRLKLLTSDDAKGEVARTVVSNWAKLDPNAARNWVVSDSEIQDLRWALMNRLLREVSQEDPEKALKWALEEPINTQQRGMGLEQWVVQSVALQGNYEKAIEMASRARDIENRNWSFIWIGNVMVRRGKSDDAWSLLQDLPDRFRSLYEEQVAANWVWAEPDIAIGSLESLPTETMRRDVARHLFYENTSSHMFSKEQMRKLKKYLPERYQQLIE